ncbi:MAG: DUF3488 and transglutaminase-like domain-containing protein [Pseudomonadales bacterium]
MTTISRASLFWVLGTQLALVLPHIDGLPLWLFVIGAICGCWRILIYREMISFPGKLIKFILFISGFTLVGLSYGGHFNLDMAVSLLVLAFFFKLLETRQRRDMYITIFLGFFIAATRLLYSQSIYATFYAILCCLGLITALLAMHQSEPSDIRGALKRGGSLMLQATPMLLVLFFLFPRVPPLWSVPLPEGRGVTGISDRLSPGSISELARSSATAFRASFTGLQPAPSERYWRGLVYDRFEGDEWRSSRPTPVNLPRVRGKADYNYSVTMEPSGEHWLFALTDSYAVDSGYARLRSNTVGSYLPLLQRRQIEFKTDKALRIDSLYADERERLVSLPEGVNEKTQQLGKSWSKESDDVSVLTDRALNYFVDNGFFYTLKPGQLGRDAMDQFLFDSRRGYCEHYASAFVYLMRAAGVPSRVVAGYQGGELNPYEDYLLVRQYDAHAWAEVWHEGRGWVRVDPTEVVAPDRISDGANSSLSRRNEYNPDGIMGLISANNLQWLNLGLLWLDSVNHLWNSWFLAYDNRMQADWLQRLWGKTGMEELLRLMCIGVVVVFIAYFIWGNRNRIGQRSGITGMAAQYFRRVAYGQSISYQATDTVSGLAKQLALRHPAIAPLVRDFSQAYESSVYDQSADCSVSGLYLLLLALKIRLKLVLMP